MTTAAAAVVSGQHEHVVGELIDIYDSSDHQTFGVTTLNFRDNITIDEYGNIDAAASEAAATVGTTTILSITASKASGSTYTTNASGTGFTKTGDDGNLLGTGDLFNFQEAIEVYYNGTYCHKGQDVVWESPYSFTLNIEADTGDTIIILTRPLVPTRTTIISITGSKPVATYDVTADGVNYTQTGDDGDLTSFDDEIVSIFYNGVYCHKGVDVEYVSDTTFTLNVQVDSGDELIILT